VRQGNEHFAAGRFADALKCYERAAALADRRQQAEILHDQAAAHFRLGDLQAARDLWVRVKETGDPQFEARTRYNLGNCDYSEALAAAARQDIATAMQRLNDAIQQYRAALRLDAALADARANLELAETLKRQLAAQQARAPQSQSASQPTCEREEGQTEQQDKAGSQPASQPRGQPESSASQESAEQSPQQSSPSQPPSDQPRESEPGQSNEGKAQQQQAPGRQPEPETERQKETRQRDSDGQPVPVEMTREQAERLLQMIRDAEKARREMLARQRVAAQKPVERDW